jgi:hypothetical protein
MPIRLGLVPLAIGPAQPPGHLIPLDQLPESHPALRYIIDRGFSRWSLQHEYGVAYCEHALMPYGMASNRLYIPIHRNGVLVGWQCRYLGTPESGAPPKYFSMRGMPKNKLLYNFDNAKDSALVVVCEGPTDVWRIGRPAVAIFGKTLSQAQKLLLETHWLHRPIVLMLDGSLLAWFIPQEIASSHQRLWRDQACSIT